MDDVKGLSILAVLFTISAGFNIQKRGWISCNIVSNALNIN